ncbi:MAG: hypothetical protein HZB15_14470 [Actinobacteria bacterium]|nr:hypothetical protein [Actinomycetota bacterium]
MTTRRAMHRLVLTGCLAASSLGAVLGSAGAPPVHADSRADLAAPSGTQRFGSKVTILGNGNYVISDYGYDIAGATDVGAVFLYDGRSNRLISTLTGSTTNDRVGVDVEPVGTGNFVVGSYGWANGAASQAGAATWVNGTTGLNGVVSAANSLVGTRTNDYVGNDIRVLTNGNYVVGSYLWDSATAADVGAATWADGNVGVTGVVSAANSLVGTTAGDEVGTTVRALTNGNYAVSAYLWDNGAVVDAGAATWGDGTVGTVGVVSPANSIVGSHPGDHVGDSIEPLPNGNWVTGTATWSNGISTSVGAVTWRPGTSAAPGVVSAVNSIVGSTTGDEVGRVATAWCRWRTASSAAPTATAAT